MNFQAPSKPTDTSSTDGLVAQLISLRKWGWKFLEIRFAFCFYFDHKAREANFHFLISSFSDRLSCCLLQKVNLWKKLYVIYSFFFVRKIVAHIVTFVFYCIVMPATVLVPEVEVPKWGAVYIPSIITLLNAVGTPRSLYYKLVV